MGHDEPAPGCSATSKTRIYGTGRFRTAGNQRRLASHPFDFELWTRFEQRELEREGLAILRYENELVTKLASHATLVEFEGATVPAVQSSVLTSQIGERLSAEHPFA